MNLVCIPHVALLLAAFVSGAGLAAQGFRTYSQEASRPGARSTPQTCAMREAGRFTVCLHDAEPLHGAILLVELGRAGVPIGGACRLLVQPQLTLPALSSPQERVEWPLPSPLRPDPRGRGHEPCFQHLFQHLVEDAGGRAMRGGCALPNGFHMRPH